MHNLAELRDACLRWMVRCAAGGLPPLSGRLHKAEVLYGWQAAPGRGSARAEPVAVFSGDVSPLSTLADAQVKDALCELGALLGGAAGQRRVYATYLDEAWILEAP